MVATINQIPRGKEQFVAQGARCWECPLARLRSVRSEINNPRPELVLVGEAPGKREVAVGRPFIGKSGEVLDYALKQGAVPRKSLAVVNAIACGPIASDSEVIKASALRACRPRLIKELRTLRPKVLMAIGAKALTALAPPDSSGVTALRGSLLGVADDVATDSWRPALMSSFHPAHILRGGDGDRESPEAEDSSSVDVLYYFLLFDLAKAWRFANGQAAPWTDDVDLFIHDGDALFRAVTNEDGEPMRGASASSDELFDALERVVDEAETHGEISCDVETDARDSLDANLTAIAYATPLGGVSATWEAWRLFPAVVERLRRLHANRRQRWNWQNGIYDRVVLRRHGLAVAGPHEDTLLKHHGAFPGLPHGLDQIAAQFFVTVPWKNEFRRSTKNLAELVLYNARDAIATAKLSPALDRFVQEARAGRVYEADRQVNVIATYMREVGLYVDRVEQARHREVQSARLEYMRKSLAVDFAEIEQKWREALARLLADRQRKADSDVYADRVEQRYREISERTSNPSDVGLFKPKAKLDIVALFEVLRIPFTDFTKTGLPVTDKKAMEGAAARHPLMRKLIHVREAQHLIATYIELPVKADGRMHPDWKTNKITGRWGAGKSQNVPNNVAGWPPETNPNGSFKTNANGSLVTPRDNLRSIIAAPTAEQILECVRNAPGCLPPAVVLRARRGFGRRLVGADMDQVELRILAFLSRDPFLLGIFNEGRDPHAEFSRYIFPEVFPALEKSIADAGFKPKASDKVEDEIATCTDEGRSAKLKSVLKSQKQWKRLRDFTKRVEYGGAYRGTPQRIWEALVKDLPEVELTNVEHGIRVFYERAAAVPKWHNEQDTLCRVRRESRESLLGRVRLFPLGNFSPNVAVNFPIQAYAASLMSLGILRFTALTHPELLEFDRLYRFGLLDARWVNKMRDLGCSKWLSPCNPVTQVHDQLVAECDEEDAEKARQLLQEAMTIEQVGADGTRMVYSAEAKISQRWSRT